jgi:hypothetical protein
VPDGRTLPAQIASLGHADSFQVWVGYRTRGRFIA